MTISTVTSEALQLKLRELLPSQQGFGTDLSASDTIIPIIDLTRAAEGSEVSETLQQALAFGSQTGFEINSGTVVIANTPGFYRIVGVLTSLVYSSPPDGYLTLDDGTTTKEIWGHYLNQASSTTGITSDSFDLVVFLASGETLSAVAGVPSGFKGSSRQIADINGTLVNPVGFTPS